LTASQNAFHLRFTAQTCALAPEAVEAYPAVVALARRATELAPNDRTMLEPFGCILYRSGQYAEALKQLTAALQAPEHPHTTVTFSHYFLAMTYHRLGHRDEARSWFDKAAQATEEMLREDRTEFGTSLPWDRRLKLQLFRAEVAALLGEAELAPPPQAVPEARDNPRQPANNEHRP
jgi:tetratricopeptide (TPR) repeat protein